MTDQAIVLRKLAALRNRIAHGHASVDVARICTELPDGIAALQSFQAAIVRHIEPGK